MTQPTDRPGIDQLRNLADRTERGPLTADEAGRLRNGIDQLYQRIDTLEAVCKSNKQAYVGAVKHAWEVEEQAKQAEATITAVRELTQRMHDWDGDRPAVGKWVDELCNLLDQHGQTPA